MTYCAKQRRDETFKKVTRRHLSTAPRTWQRTHLTLIWTCQPGNVLVIKLITGAAVKIRGKALDSTQYPFKKTCDEQQFDSSCTGAISVKTNKSELVSCLSWLYSSWVFLIDKFMAQLHVELPVIDKRFKIVLMLTCIGNDLLLRCWLQDFTRWRCSGCCFHIKCTSHVHVENGVFLS